MGEVPYQPPTPSTPPPLSPVPSIPLEPGRPLGQPPAASALPQPWGPWMTILWLVVIMGIVLGAGIAAGVVIAIGYVMVTGGSRHAIESIPDQPLLAAGAVVQLLTIPAIAFLVRLRRMTLADYVGRSQFGLVQFLMWGLIFVAVLIAQELTMHWLEIDQSAAIDFMRSMTEPTIWLPFVFIGAVIIAPITEEMLFRGFVLGGMQATRRRMAVGVLISAGVWAAVHLQYGAPTILCIFIGGLLLGVIRLRTGSLGLCIILHAAQNLWSMGFATLTMHD